jgi:P-type Mg2+ transporter
MNFLRMLARQFASPLILILLFAASVSLFVGEWTDAVVIAAIVAGSGLISLAQEYSAGNAIAKLRERLAHRATVLRDGRSLDIESSLIVPGDVIELSAGSLVPADSVVLEAKDFFVSQAALTGETFPVEKRSGTAAIDATLSERVNCVFMGTSVRSGTALVVAVRTGAATEYGQIAGDLRRRAPETDFARGIRQFGLLLSRLMIGLILAVFAINIISEKPPIDSLLFAIALAVGLSPELLPAIITICLSRGARNMARHGVIVRRLDSIENLGSMDILCTDKTGTLTEGVIRLDGAFDVSGVPSEEVHQLAFLNATFQTGLSNPLDQAIISRKTLNVDAVTKIGEVPYDFARKRLSVAVKRRGEPSRIIMKGAVDNVLGVCEQVRLDGEVVRLMPAERKNLLARYREWSEQGFRVLAVASRKLPEGCATVVRSDEIDMIVEGFVLFSDRPKSGVRETIASLANHGVRLKLITGDNRFVARHVAEQVGLANDRLMTGAELNDVADDALGHSAEHTDLFAEVDPNQKERIIRALQKRGHVVGFLGDGINDAPAMHDADVGISVDGAVEVAREAADIVLLKKGLDVLREGIVEGRRTFANSLKYIFTTTSANFGNMLSMAAASLFLPFLPLLAKQILLNNFLSDIPAIAIAGDRVDAEYIRRPHRWDMKFIRSFMITFGLISSVFDFITFGILIYVFRAVEAQFQTAWFIESLLTELLVALVVRTAMPFYKSRPSGWLVLSTGMVAILALILPFIPAVYVFGFVPLPLEILAVIVSITLLYLVVTEVAKRFVYRGIQLPRAASAT